jgi:hypothetical protein
MDVWMAFYDITGTMIMALLLWLDGIGDPSRSVFDRTERPAARE